MLPVNDSLSNLVDNFAEGIHKTKFKYRHDNKKGEKNVKLNTKIESNILMAANVILKFLMLKMIN